MNLPQLLCDFSVGGYGIGSLVLFFIGIVIAVAIVYAIMRAVNSPAWVYTGALVVGLVILLLIVVQVFFGGGSFRGVDRDVQIRGR